MSLSQTHATYETNESPKKLLKFANEKRQEGLFDDVSIKVGRQILQGNRMILSCYSKVLEKMFQSQMKEQYQDTIEIKDYDEEAMKMLIDFMYEGNITIQQENVMKLLATSDFLQLEEIKEFCFDFLQKGITVENCIDILDAYILFNPQSSINKVYSFIGENLDELAQTDQFKTLPRKELVSLIANVNNAEQTSRYEAVRHWIKYDEEQRREDFPSLFQLIDLHQLPYDYLENVVAVDHFVKENIDCLNAVVSLLFKKLREVRFSESGSKILRMGGDCNRQKVIEVYNIFGTSNTIYPDLPVAIIYHCAVSMNNIVYCIGGMNTDPQSTRNVYRLDLNEQILKWEEVCSMNQMRISSDAAIFEDCIVVCGGSSITNLDSAELYETKSNKWTNISSMNRVRSGHALVECNGYLYALGGSDIDDSPTVERLSKLDGEWEPAASMRTPRYYVVAVTCDGYIYVIGGIDRQGKKLKTVEKFDPVKNEWSYVSNMNNARYEHSACVLRGRIFVVGGTNEKRDDVSEIECYDTLNDSWSIVANVAHKAIGHTLVVV